MALVTLVTIGFLAIVGLSAQDVLRTLLAPQLGIPPTSRTHGALVSVLIPARNEAARISACLEGLAQQHYRSFEVIVVDDHSSDGTAEVVKQFAGRLPALSVLTGAELPSGWAGKCWACWQAAAQARGEWLLFLDADVAPQPDLLAALVERAEHASADAITLMPRQVLDSLAELLLIPAFQTILYGVYPLHVVSKASSGIGFFNGQAILIRRAVYAATDGHRSVRASVLEDADFGAQVKAAGFSILAAEAFDLLDARMYTDWPSVREGLGKNAVAGYRSGGWRSGWVGFRQTLIAYGGVYMLLAGALLWAGGAGVLGIVVLAHGLALQLVTLGVIGWLFRRRYNLSPLWGLGYPLGLTLYFALAFRGFIRVRSGRGVVWKGRVLSGR